MDTEMEPVNKRPRTDEASSAAKVVLPQRPKAFLASRSSSAFHEGMDEVLKALVEESEMKDKLQGPTRELRNAAESSVRQQLEGEPYDASKCQACLEALFVALKDCPEWMREMSWTNNAISAFVASRCLAEFFESGKLLTKKGNFDQLTSSEYILGVIRFAEDIETYAIGRATWQDAASVAVCSVLIQAISYALMQFNFRNGNLRRRYDSVKYRVKKLENMLYELSLVFGEEEIQRVRDSCKDLVLVDPEEFPALSQELDKATEEREKVIKATRDPQKSSKNAIYMLHRGNLAEGRKMLENTAEMCRKIAAEAEMTRDTLHSGSYGNALEEYAEARIFEEWLVNDGALLPFAKLKEEVDISAKDYLGGVVDFTGEIGRFGVAKATNRDVDSVKRVLATDLAIKEFVLQLQEVVSGKMTRKLEAVMTNTKKMENTLYELVLVTSSQRKTLNLDSTQADEGTSGDAE